MLTIVLTVKYDISLKFSCSFSYPQTFKHFVYKKYLVDNLLETFDVDRIFAASMLCITISATTTETGKPMAVLYSCL